jgi:hypothetical protein
MMSLLLFAVIALVALQFTSGIGQWISENQQATETVSWLQGLVAKIGLAPTIITTRVVIIIAVVVAYELQQHWLVWAVLAAAAWYLYKTGKYVVIWAELKNDAVNAVEGEVTNVVDTAVTDVTKVALVDPKEAQAAVALAAKGVDASKIG